MKKFETPVMVELNINETASGFFRSHVEVWPIHNGKHHQPCQPSDPSDPVIPDEGDKEETEDKTSGL